MMAELFDWDRAAANNNDAPPNGFPEGMTPSTVNNAAREVMAVLARYFQANSGVLVTNGTDDLYTLTIDQVLTAYTDRQLITFRANRTNTGPVTISINGLGVSPLFSNTGSPLEAGDIVADGVYQMVFSNNNFVLVNSAAISPQLDTFQYYQYGNAGGTFPTSTDYVWTKPAGVRRVEAWFTGGGGGGEGSFQLMRGGSGSGADTVFAVYDASTLGATEDISIGRGGLPGMFAGVSTHPTNGVDSTFGTHITALGGGAAGNGTQPGVFDRGDRRPITATNVIGAVSFTVYAGNFGSAGRQVDTLVDLKADDLFGAIGGGNYYGSGSQAIGGKDTVGDLFSRHDGTASAYGTGGGGSVSDGGIFASDNTNGSRGAGGYAMIREIY